MSGLLVRSGLVGVLLLVFALGATFLSMSGVPTLAQNATGPFTRAQVAAGHDDYLAYCANCHGANLAGDGDAPPLTGEAFAFDWAPRTIREFYQFISATMPDGLAGDLSSDTYFNIISFLLAANGAKPGPAPFNNESNVKIGAIANGQIVTAVVTGGGGP